MILFFFRLARERADGEDRAKLADVSICVLAELQATMCVRMCGDES